MGHKDDKWREAPGYCVECDRLRPLNRAAVCRDCWEAGPAGVGEDWEEDERNSRWFHQRQTAGEGGTRVRTFIFVTPEGYTFQPDSEAVEPEVENLQVLGFAEGDTPQTAWASLLAQQSGIREAGFRTALSYELAPGARQSVCELDLS